MARTPQIKKNKIDLFFEKYLPTVAAKRYRAKYAIAMSDSYMAGSRSRTSMQGWSVTSGDSNTDDLQDLQLMRERSRDLTRNAPLARAIINTKVTNIVGAGLKLNPQINYKILGLSEEKAQEWENKTLAEWDLFSTKECDVTRTNNFMELQSLVMRSILENGDCFTLFTFKERAGSPYGTKLQLIEADRVTNRDNLADTELLAGGVLTNKDGAPKEYHVLKGHPGNYLSKTNEWRIIPAFRRNGSPNILHHYHKLRIGQRRGIPDLVPVIEMIKQLTRYTDAEVMAAVVQSFFTVFVKTAGGQGLAPDTTAGGSTADTDEYKMGYGNMIDLNPDEEVSFADPSRPNKQFDGFVTSLAGMIGAAVEIPFEILLKHFTSSYSASRAALLEAWRFFLNRRLWLTNSICMPVYEAFLTEAVARGRIVAAGFNDDPLIRRAYLGSVWTGPAKGMIDEFREATAADMRLRLGITTLSEEVAALTGGEWERKHPQRVKEVQLRRDAGLEPPLEQIQEIRRR